MAMRHMAQLRTLYKDAWESIVGNCDELYYLGGNEQSTHKFISEYLGKETLDTNTYGKSSGRRDRYCFESADAATGGYRFFKCITVRYTFIRELYNPEFDSSIKEE